jgi:hypothetical protein
MQDIQSTLHQLSALEVEFSNSKFLTDDTSPRGVGNTTLIQRYEQARDLYLQRRLENLLVDHIATYDGETIELPEIEDDSDLIERNEHAFRTLQASLSTLHTQVDQLRHTRDAVQSRRQELERMVHDLQQEDESETDIMEEDDTMSLDPSELEREQARIEELQQQKRQLQDRLEQLQRQAKEAQECACAKREQVQLLQREIESSENGAEAESKLRELLEMKDFYDSLRHVLEELGGVKIVKVEEITQENSSNTPHLCLSLLFYQDYPVQITLQVYRKIFLKLVDAQWNPTNGGQPVVQAATKDYELPLEPLQDLVQTALSTLGPPHDLRFIVRETLARIRLSQTRANQLAELRHRYIMKLYGNQVTCSLNEGIIIVLRLYEKHVKLDDLVGINGWDDGATAALRTNVQRRLESEYAQDEAEIALYGSKITPLVVVELVQEEMRKTFANPRTPRMPVRSNGGKRGF